MKIFLSVGSTYTEEQEAFVQAFEAFLVQNGCERLTVGRGNYRADQPILAARELMQRADGIVVIGFTRVVVERAIEKPNSQSQTVIEDRRQPTIWNQLEAAMGFGLNIPLLMILETRLHQEAMLKDRHEFRAIVTDLDVNLFSTDEFKGTFAHWRSLSNDTRNRSSVWKGLDQRAKVALIVAAVGTIGVVLAAAIKILPDLIK